MRQTVIFLLSSFIAKGVITIIVLGGILLLFYGTPKSDIPNLDETNTLAGIDSNDNGIRDDIDRYIKETYFLPEQQNAVSQYARNLQSSLLVDKTDREALRLNRIGAARAISCVFDKIPSENTRINGSIIQDIIAATINTKLRKTEFKKLNQALDGTSTSLEAEDFCDG